MKDLDISELEGKTLAAIKGRENSEEIIFETTDGKKYILFHKQECCEQVAVEDICGDFSDLIGNPILLADEVSNSDDPIEYKDTFNNSHTWTFYKFSTIKGSVTIRWLGESNGYYSEGVNFCEI